VKLFSADAFFPPLIEIRRYAWELAHQETQSLIGLINNKAVKNLPGAFFPR